MTRAPDKGTTEPITEPFALRDVAVSPLDGTGWAISFEEDPADPMAEQGHLVHRLTDGTVVDVLNIAEYQKTDPDPFNSNGPLTESNPYGLTVMRNGDALVTDAAGNDLIRVTPDGVATTVARFDVQKISTDHLPPNPSEPPLPTTIEAEAVPTTVTIGPDGAIYVGELKGFPFRPGTSNIWRINRNAKDAVCSVDTPDPSPDPKCSLYSDGYTAIQDIAFDQTNGNLYVYELAADGVLAFEAALDDESGTVPFPPAVLLEVRRPRGDDNRSELAPGALSQPGGVVSINDNIYVTDGVFTSGRLLQVHR